MHERHRERWHDGSRETGPYRRGRRRGGGGSRIRWRDGHGWFVIARVERFVEPALLLTLREQTTHGYDLRETLGEILGPEAVDAGNLYRMLKKMEEEGIVTSELRDDLPGHRKRLYTLTELGEELLDAWAESLEDCQSLTTAFLERHKQPDPPHDDATD